MYQPIHLETKSPSLRNSINRSLVALVTLLLAAIGGTQSIHAKVSEPSAAPNDTSWVPTGRLNTPRYNHTATLLPNGKVLAAGGDRPGGPRLPSAELYGEASLLGGPATGGWNNTNSLANPRSNHTATLLPNGKVLVAGGAGAGTSAELYDPATGLWSNTGDLGSARSAHTATLLPNGTFLVAGGAGAGTSAEVYDPVTGSWTNTGSLGTARSAHTATLLPNGKVLVAGGVGAGTSAELYDPATGLWSPTGSLGTARSAHTATLLPSGKVLVAGGPEADTNTELYDPATGSWSSTSNLNTRDDHTATLLPNGKVLVAGGESDTRFGLSSALLYNPAKETWSSTGSLKTGRSGHTATLLASGLVSGDVLVVGGEVNGRVASSSAELYDPGHQLWFSTGSLSTARTLHTATLLPNGKVLVAGGDAGGLALSSAELYDPETGVWSSTGSLSTARSRHTATLLSDGKVLVAGGRGNRNVELSSGELYDPETGVWSSTGSLSTARSLHTATLLPNSLGWVLVAGGLGSCCSLSSAELYHPNVCTNCSNWSSTGSLSTARFKHTATLLSSGKVLVAGGFNTPIGPLSSAELYDPATGNWSNTGSLGARRYHHTATLLPNGKVLVAGGLDSSGILSSAELFDPGLGFDASWQPLVTRISPPILRDRRPLMVSGSRFKGISEASGGNGAQNSSSNYPLVQLLSLTNEQTIFLPLNAWSDTDFTSKSINLMTTSSSGFPIGYALVTVFTNGIPSQSQFVEAEPATPRP